MEASRGDLRIYKLNQRQDPQAWELQSLLELVKKVGTSPGFDWPSHYVQTEWSQSVAWGAVSGGNLVAGMFLKEGLEHHEIMMLAVDPECQGQGYGLQLLQYILQYYQELSRSFLRPTAREIWLEVHHNNSRALGLYKRIGFQVVGERPRYYRDGGKAILMSLQIKP